MNLQNKGKSPNCFGVNLGFFLQSNTIFSDRKRTILSYYGSLAHATTLSNNKPQVCGTAFGSDISSHSACERNSSVSNM